VDVNNSSSFTFTGNNVNSSVTESANGASGSANSLTYENSTVTNSLVFGTGKYLSFANTVKPDLTNGASIQFVAYLTASSYNSSWPRILDFGPTGGWGSGNDEFSIQLSDSGQLQIYMNRSGTAGTYFCGTSSSAVIPNTFALYSMRVGPSGVCNIAVDGTDTTTTNTESTVSYASQVPGTSGTMNFRIGSMAFNVQSTLPNGKFRSFIFSSGTTSSNSVTFMENGGTGFMASELGSVNKSLNSNSYTKTGYTFTGWNTKSDGTGTSYSEGATFPFAAKSSMLFAQWSVVPPSMTLTSLAAANYRTSTPITLTINTAGNYTFYDTGKRIPGCVKISGTPPTVTCNWRPSKIGPYVIRAVGLIGGTTYYSNSSSVNVIGRTGKR
jgi:hypothetical protein